jgi:hypothetical protein
MRGNLMIKVQTKQIIDVSDLDDLVEKTYGKPYNFQQQDGCKDRGNHHITVPDSADDFPRETIPEEINGMIMGVSFAAWLARDPKEWNGDSEDEMFINLFWERNFYPDVQMIANDLHAKGLFPAGEYVIEIDW